MEIDKTLTIKNNEEYNKLMLMYDCGNCRYCQEIGFAKEGENWKKYETTFRIPDEMKEKYKTNSVNKLFQIELQNKYFQENLKIRIDEKKKEVQELESLLKPQQQLDNNLITASKEGNLEEVKSAIDEGANVHAYDDYALRYASRSGHLEIVKFLVENGANIHADDDYALRWASTKGHLETVKYLVKHGADIHAHDDYALGFASAYGHLEVVKYLVENGANIHADDDLALRWASADNHQEVVKYLERVVKKEKNKNNKKGLKL